MPNLGPMELLIIGSFLALLAVAAIALMRRSARPSTPAPRLDPAELHHRVRDLTAQGRAIQAIKLIREQTGLGLADAKRYADDVAAGRAPLPPGGAQGVTRRGGADLAGRVRELKAAGRAEQALFLVRGETGMAEADARRFVDAIE
ncbi:50S ribosomal protein L7/L12 [Planomonospora sp. ID91781]|uniref:50S ribosomal protein L7/L12 n=1 Tax=Planomonospora sp. ID91781 TaxID=2738135 RepID=UPI0018C40322|nr:50S ribosomal protein L7/L12 [Planomonospora sp. ID91781]MBG0823219.1 50S ribosomal protein L7/L12 [Planomonospora sp. ID91781]